MQIRKMSTADMEHVLDIWLRGSVQAHDFVDPQYWVSNMDAMKNTYLPMADTYVLEVGGRVLGFISMLDHYLAALFIDPDHSGQGYGSQLLNYVKHKLSSIELKVYRLNHRAVKFYANNGFIIQEELTDEQTSEQEYRMTWYKHAET